jgi:uncharacterized coiled-coil protein SlyX
MYENRTNVGLGSVGALAGGFVTGQLAKSAKDETTLAGLNRNLLERAVTLHALCERLDNFSDRLEPQPRPTSAGESQTQPPMLNDFHGMNQRIDMLTVALGRLQSICDRLDRIA